MHYVLVYYTDGKLHYSCTSTTLTSARVYSSASPYLVSQDASPYMLLGQLFGPLVASVPHICGTNTPQTGATAEQELEGGQGAWCGWSSAFDIACIGPVFAPPTDEAHTTYETLPQHAVFASLLDQDYSDPPRLQNSHQS